MDISGILRMLIDSKSKESARNNNTSKKTTPGIELFIQNLECHKAFEKRCAYLEWIEKITKKAILERLEDKLKLSETHARQECLTLIKRMSQQSRNRHHDSSTRLTFHYGENPLHFRKQHTTKESELINHLIEWCEKMMDRCPLGFVIGYNTSDEDYYDWDLNILYKLPKKPIWNSRDQHPWQKRFVQANLSVTPPTRKSHTRRGIDSRCQRVIKNPGLPLRKDKGISNKFLPTNL